MTFDHDRDRNFIRIAQAGNMERRAAQELQGIAAHIVYDCEVDEPGISFLREWMHTKAEYRSTWPFDELFDLIDRVMADGAVDKGECGVIFVFLSALAASPEGYGTAKSNIFDDHPEIVFPARSFLFTGRMAMGKRHDAEVAVMRLGGVLARSPRRDLDYLVVGDLGTDKRATSRYGTKIEAVMQSRRAGGKTLVVREVDFCRAIVDADAARPC
jgi:NAD-dependent DNA ligase